MLRGLAVVLAALALVPSALAGGPSLAVGAADDIVRQPTLLGSTAKLQLAKLAGLDSMRVTAIWQTGDAAPTAAQLAELQQLAAAAALADVRIFVSVYPSGSRFTPLTDEARAEFAGYAAALAQGVPEIRDFIVGNEPNLNRFWLPQFNPDGSDAAAPAYVSLLAATYDALKAVEPTILVYGGAVSPRGIDRPGSGRDTHSPTTFIPDMGAAYRLSGRTLPIMDAFAFHPYQDNSSQPPTFTHPNSSTVSLSDYPKLVALLGRAFDGTAQPGSTLPILYDEFGVESQVPAERTSLYTGSEIQATRPVDEATQGAYYGQALAIAFCQPTVVGLLTFNLLDEPALDRLQSGLYYPDGTAKTSLAAFREAARKVRGGTIAACPGLKLTPRATLLYPATPAALARPRLRIRLECTIDCAYQARIERMPGAAPVATVKGTALGRVETPIVFPARTLAPGRYRFRAVLTAPVNPGPVGAVRSPVFRVGPAPAG